MNRRIVVLIFSILVIMSVTACGNDKIVKEASSNYENGNYEQVMKDLEQVKDEDTDAMKIYQNAKLCLAIENANEKIDNKEYEEVINLLAEYVEEVNVDFETEELSKATEIYQCAKVNIAITEANKLCEKGKYEEAMEFLVEYLEDEEANALYEEIQFNNWIEKVKGLVRNTKTSEVIEQILEFEKLYEKDEKKKTEIEDKLNASLENYFEDDINYDDFENWEKVVSGIKKNTTGECSELIKKINKNLKSKATLKLQLALTGKWIREDDTTMSGSYIDVSFKGETGVAILTKAAKNYYGFKKGDIKWKDIKIVDDTTFVFDDLRREAYTYYDYWSDSYITNYSHDYEEGTGELDFKRMEIKIYVTSDSEEDGDEQIWVKKATKSNKKVTDQETKVTPNKNSEYIFSNSDSTYLTDDDVSSLSKDKLRLARNEIYARHGYKFQDEGLKEYFESKSWYIGNVESSDFDESVFNKYEKKNIEKIKNYE